jgi:type IV pilus assembly protein PilW
MNTRARREWPGQLGAGLVDVLVGLVIGMLVMVVVYQVFQLSEGQKRTATSGSDAQTNAAYGLFLLGRDLSVAGNAFASVAKPLEISAPPPPLEGCAFPKDNPLEPAPGMPPLPMLRPIPVVIHAGATASDPDSLTVLYGGSGSLSTAVALLNNAIITTSSANSYQVLSPVGFSANDYIVATQPTGVPGVANCTLSIVNAAGVTVAGTGIATIAHTPLAGNMATTYQATNASLVNLGQIGSMGRILYYVDPATRTLATQQMLPPVATPVAVPVIAEVITLKAQYGLDTNDDGIFEWQQATGAWSSASLPTQPLATIYQIQAVRVAIVTRSAQYERDPVTSGPLRMFDGSISMNLTADQQHYRYKVLETVVPLRNAIWNAT